MILLDPMKVSTARLDASGSLEVLLPVLPPKQRGSLFITATREGQLLGTLTIWFEGRETPRPPFFVQLGPECASCQVVLHMPSWGDA